MAQVVQGGLGDLVNQHPLWKEETRNEEKLSRDRSLCQPYPSPGSSATLLVSSRQVMGHGLGPSKTPWPRGVFCPEQGGAEWSSLVADAGVAVMSRSMASVSDSLSSNPASPLLACDLGQDLELFQPQFSLL